MRHRSAPTTWSDANPSRRTARASPRPGCASPSDITSSTRTSASTWLDTSCSGVVGSRSTSSYAECCSTPLGLQQTTFNSRQILRDGRRAIGHATGHARVPVRVPMVAAGGLYTSVEDACRYIQFHLGEGASLLDPSLLAELYQVPGEPDRDQGYGLGTALARAGDIPVRGHGGGGFGFLSDMYWAPEAGLGVVVLTNSTSHPLQWELASEIFRDLIPSQPRPSAPPPKTVPVSAESMAAMAGDYVGRSNDPETFTVDGDQGILIRDDARHPVEFIGPSSSGSTRSSSPSATSTTPAVPATSNAAPTASSATATTSPKPPQPHPTDRGTGITSSGRAAYRRGPPVCARRTDTCSSASGAVEPSAFANTLLASTYRQPARSST